MRRRDPTAMASANPHTANACGERREIRLLNRPCLSDSLPGTPRAGAAPMLSPPPTRLLPSPTGDGVAPTYPRATPSSTFPTRSRRPYNVILMQLHPFALERYFARYEFAVRHLLSASDCDGPSLTELLALADDEVTSAWQALRLGYTESQGLPALRAEVAAWCLQTLDNRAPRKAVIHDSAGQGATVAPRSPALRADDVLLCAPEEGILLMMLALVGPHDHVVSIFPGYQSLYDIARGKGARVDFWRPREEEGWRFAVEDLQKLVRPGVTKLVVCNFPHNPTGYVPPAADFDRIVRLVEDAGAILFSDEMYLGLEMRGTEALPCAAALSETAVALGGVSKSLGLPGLRLGWLVSRNTAVLSACATLKDYTTICSAAPSELLALAALRARRTILAENLARVTDNLRLLQDFCDRHPGLLQVAPPRGGTVCFPRLLSPAGASDLCRALAEDAGVLLLPSTVYDYGDTHVRVGLGRRAFPEALQAFEEFIRRYPGAYGGTSE